MIRGLDRLGRERHSRGILIAGKPSPRLHGRKEHASFGRRCAVEKWVIQDDDPPNELERRRPRRQGCISGRWVLHEGGYERWGSPCEIVWKVEELVFHRLTECGFDLHFLQTRRISIHTHG